ncbi:hypothetical protein [Agromyces salentinus]|uniref:Uncharacterized protein n=1 Tax=Agromyces salentinus TaxID=269421 RepID=A0ABP4Z8V6_9MICO|nr:hypothetical protein [Agromyces salentinus]
MSANAPDDRPDAPTATSRQAVRGYRRIAIIVLVASLSITAVIGIVTLLSGEFGEVQGRVLLTTLVIAGASILALCHLTVIGRPVRAVGFVGLVTSAVALLLGLVVVWTPWTVDVGDWVGDAWRWFGVASILAASLAHANLLLLLSGRRRRVVRIALAITLSAIAIVAAMLILPILTDWAIPGPDGETYWRWFGVIAILDALGTIVLPVVALLLRDRPAPTPPDAAGGPDAASARSALDERIEALSAATGLDRDALLHAALDAFEARRGSLPG